MIKVNELRIGNILNYTTAENDIILTDLEWQDIQWISEDEEGFNLANKPIKLTEDWLLYFGFSGKDNFTDYNLQTDNLKFYYGNNDLTIAEFEFGHAISVKIEYVHQLQNIYFALTRQELKAK